MSFILDALKKADAERNLGHLPGIHTRQSVEAPLLVAPGAWRRRHGVVVLLCGVAIALTAAGAWQLGSRRHAPVNPVTAPLGRDAETAALDPGLVGTPVAARPATNAEVPGTAAVPPPATELPVPKPLPPLPRTASGRALSKEAMPAPKKTAPAPQRATDMTLVDLPPAIQREIPPLAISGSMYSANPADRMLLVDKRMLHEGDEVAPGIVLESVLPKGALLRYKGHVFRVSN